MKNRSQTRQSLPVSSDFKRPGRKSIDLAVKKQITPRILHRNELMFHEMFARGFGSRRSAGLESGIGGVARNGIRKSRGSVDDFSHEFFLRAIRDNLDLTAHLQGAVDSLRIILAADQSFREGRTS